MQVAQEVQVSWVQTRMLTKAQISGLKERLDAWVSRVEAVSSQVEGEALGMAEA